MRFGQILRSSIYKPWEPYYIDYAKLKKLLREDRTIAGGSSRNPIDEWTELDEETFVQELTEVQLKKVNNFYSSIYRSFEGRIKGCEKRLEKVIQSDDDEAGKSNFDAILHELDGISKEVNELKKYCQVNFTGFFKAAKKHDRKRGETYRIRAVLQARMEPLSFMSDDFSSLLYRLSIMYSFIQQSRGGDTDDYQPLPGSDIGGDEYTAHKFFVHLDNLLQVKTAIIQYLPILIYNPQSSKVLEGNQNDPSITSLYFDNPKFSLYSRRVGNVAPSSSLRLRWSGSFQDRPEIFLEKKTISKNDTSQEIRFSIKAKNVFSFIKGEYHMEKNIQKLRDRQGEGSIEASQLEKNILEIQKFIRENELQPVLRANYQRTAFQIPGDDRIRVSIDTNLAMIREDSLNNQNPTRAPNEWHRLDIDDQGLQYPFDGIGEDEITRFPFALLEIKVKESIGKKAGTWASELMSSHLVKEIPKFSKFTHGVALLFEDYVNSLPFWLSSLEADFVRGDPNKAWEEEQAKKQRKRGSESAFGSYTGSKVNPKFVAHASSPAGRSEILDTPRSTEAASDVQSNQSMPPRMISVGLGEEMHYRDSEDNDGRYTGESTGLRSLLPTFSVSRYARAHRMGHKVLPKGVHKPSHFMKDSGEVEVEPKVWLANQRTYIKWCHIAVLLASLSIGLFNAAGRHNTTARVLAIVYILVAIFAGCWGFRVYTQRTKMIMLRSGKDFDSIAGPIVVCVGLLVALIMNFIYKYQDITGQQMEQSFACTIPTAFLHQQPDGVGRYGF